MNPEDEIRFAEAFNELGDAAELMVEPPAVAAIRGKVRRRRATRVAVAAVAALALVAPASWMLQQAATAEERDTPQVADDGTNAVVEAEQPTEVEEPAPSEDPTPDGEEGSVQSDSPPTFEDLVGTTLDWQSAIPVDASLGMAPQDCMAEGAVLEDGRTGDYMEDTYRIGLLEVVHTPMTEGGRDLPVLHLGCRFGEAAAYWVVVLDQAEGDGSWYPAALIRASQMNADSPYDIAPGTDHGVLVGVAERYVCCDMDPDELEYWVESISLDSDFRPVISVVDEGVLPDLAVTVEATKTDEEGVWTVRATIRNNGEATSGNYDLSACADPAEIKDVEFAFGDCLDGKTLIEDIGPLEPGEEHTTSWEVTVAPSSAWVDGAFLWFAIAPNTFTADGIARDQTFADNEAFVEFTE